MRQLLLASLTLTLLVPACEGPGGPPSCSPDDCDDGDSCTLDGCDDDGLACVHQPLSDCECRTDADCDDADACTDDACVLGQCQSVPIMSEACSCTTDADCDEGGMCDVVSCVEGRCETTPIPDCCTTASDCPPSTATCFRPACAAMVCGEEMIPGCVIPRTCEMDTDCDDGDACTRDECSAFPPMTGECSNSPIPGCGAEPPYGKGLFSRLRDAVPFGRGLVPASASGAALNLVSIPEPAARGIVIATESSGVVTATYASDTDFASAEGPATVEVFHGFVPPGPSSTPSFRASWNTATSRYDFEAVVPVSSVPWHVPVFVTWPGGGTTTSIGTTSAPVIDEVLGTATIVSVPEDAGDALFMQSTALCGAERVNMEATTELDGVPPVDGAHPIPLFTAAQVAALGACTLERVSVATIDCTTTDTLFTGTSEHRLCSGDMLEIDAALLEPAPGAGPCGAPVDTAGDTTHRAAIGDLSLERCDLRAGSAHPFVVTGLSLRDDGAGFQVRVTYRNPSDTHAPVVPSHGVVSGTPSFGYSVNGLPLATDIEVRVQLSVIFPGQPDLSITLRRDGEVYAVSRYERVPPL